MSLMQLMPSRRHLLPQLRSIGSCRKPQISIRGRPGRGQGRGASREVNAYGRSNEVRNQCQERADVIAKTGAITTIKVEQN